MHRIDLIIVFSYLLLVTAVGLYRFKMVQNIEDYTVGDKNFSTFAVIATLFATYISSQYVLGKSAKVYELGGVFIIPLLLNPLIWIITSFFYSKKISRFQDCISIVDIMHHQYKSLGRYLTMVASVTMSLAAVAIQITAIAYLSKEFFEMSYEIGAFIGIGVVIFYSILGGIRSVILTDMLQFLIFFFFIPAGCGYAYFHSGGYDHIMTQLPADFLSVEFNSKNITYMCSVAIYFLLPFTEASYFQRFLIARNSKQMKLSLATVTIFCLILSLITSVIALLVKSYNPSLENYNHVFYYFVNHLLPVGFKGLVIVGFLAVIQSTADSWINTASSIIAKDFVGALLPRKLNDKQLVLTARIAAIIIACAAIVISLHSREVMDLVFLVINFYYPIVFVPIFMCFYKHASNQLTFLVSIIFAYSFVVITRRYTGGFDVVTCVVGIGGSAIGYFLAHYLQLNFGLIKTPGNARRKYKPSLKQTLQHITNYLLTIKKQIESSRSSYYMFIVFLIILNIPLVIFGYFEFKQSLNVIIQYSRYFILCCVLSIILHGLYSKKQPAIIWHVLFFTSLPFLNVNLFISSDFGLIWGINAFFSIVTLFLLTNFLYALTVSLLGITASWMCYKTLLSLHISLYTHDFIIDDQILATYSVATIILTNIFILYNKNKDDRLKRQAFKTMGFSIAHEVISPLSIGVLQLQQLKKNLKEKKLEAALKCADELYQVNQLAMQDIDTTLSALSNDPTVQPNDWGEFDIIPCIRDSIESYCMTKEQKNRLFFADNGKCFKVIGSKDLLCIVMHNILKNAFKYAGDQAKVQVFINGKEVTIKDNGCGIQPEVLRKIFTRYVSTEGSGIGLNFCKEAMQQMHGDIKCISELGKGTEIILDFS